MSVELAQEHMAWNLEAVERCSLLSTESSCPTNVRQLFHALSPQQATNSCLLQQISRLVMAGLESSADACVKATEAPYGVASTGSAVRTAIAKAASNVSSHAAGSKHYTASAVGLNCLRRFASVGIVCDSKPAPSMHTLHGGCIVHQMGAILKPVCCAMPESVFRMLPDVVNCAAGQQ